ncbi:GtrA family protein [Vibrio cholerae]|nr:GtrA family protein [Vibrio cholerae]
MSIVQRLGSFTIVGLVAFVVDFSLFNIFSSGLGADPVVAKILSVAAATAVSWAGSRFVTFKELGGRSTRAETSLFAITNLIGLGLAAGCLYISHYLLGFTSVFADNVAGNVFGVLLGNVLRYFSYRYVVFQPSNTSLPAASTATSYATGDFTGRVHA